MSDETIDVGHVHTLTEPGGPCLPACPHPVHRLPRGRVRDLFVDPDVSYAEQS